MRELRTYLGLRFLMGLQPRPNMKSYWSHDPLMALPIFPHAMMRDRFVILTSALNFANESQHPKNDRLWMLRPVLDILDKQFSTVFIPSKTITMDESLWAFRGRHHALQYIPRKKAKKGIKVYKLCSGIGQESGYTTAFKIYMGQDHGDFPASMKAVVDLMEKGQLFDKGYELYTDNWYSSPTLFQYLKTRKTNAVGTGRQMLLEQYAVTGSICQRIYR